MTTHKRNKSRRASGNGKPPVKDDFRAIERSIYEARCIIETSFAAIDQADNDRDGDGVIAGTNTLRVGVRALRSVEEMLDRFSIRLFHEGCPPEDVEKLRRESAPRLPPAH